MNLDEALARLPEAYAVAIRLRDAGQANRIADELHIPRASVGPLLRIADAKLADLLATAGPATGEPPDAHEGPQRSPDAGVHD